MDDKAGLTITMPTALFERLLKEAMARGVALSAHASERVVAALQGGVPAPVTSERELDLARQLKEMAAKAAEARNAVLAARTAKAALERRVTELTEKAQAASAPAPAPAEAEAEEAARLRKALADERAETQAQRREAGELARHCETWRARASDLDAILAARDAELEKRARRIAELESEAERRLDNFSTSNDAGKQRPAPVALAPVQIRAIRMFASLGHGCAWIAREMDLPAEVIAAALKAPGATGGRASRRSC